MNENLENVAVQEEPAAQEMPAAEQEVPVQAEVSQPDPFGQPQYQQPQYEQPVYDYQQPVYEAPLQEVKPAWKPFRKRLSLGVRIPMQILATLLFFALMVTMIATVVVVDGTQLISGNGMKTLVSSVMGLKPAADVPQAGDLLRPVAMEGGSLDDILGNLDPDDIQPPADMTDQNALNQWLMDTAKDMLGEDTPITEEQINNFIEDSTVGDFLANKVEEYTDAILEGKELPPITKDDIVNLVEENKHVIKEQFGVEITDEHMAKVEEAADKVITEGKINETIQNAVTEVVNTEVAPGMTVNDALAAVKSVFNEQVMLMMILVCVALMALILGVNFYNLPAGLTWISICCMIVGLLLSLPVLVLELTPDIYASMGDVAPVIKPLIGMIAPVHYGVFGIGLALLIASIAWRIIRSGMEKKKYAMA